MLKDKVHSIFTKHYKVLMSIPLILTILSLILIGINYSQTGDFFKKDISLRGGIAATITTNLEFSEEQIQSAIIVDSTVRKVTDLRTGRPTGYIIEVSDISSDELQKRLEEKLNLKLNSNNFSIEETGAKLGEAFYNQLMVAILFAFILMGISIFIMFRTFAPSIAVISAAFMDIVITLAVVNLLGLEISTAGITGFLLIIGYSVDTDVLLTNWAIRKREGSLFDRMYHSMKTGLTMTVAAIVVMLIGLSISNSNVIKEMFTIIFIALIVDLLSTYLTNAGILWTYCKKKGIT